MNDLEFREQYKRLTDVHPNYFGKSDPETGKNEKMNTIWEHVKDLDVDWFRRQVDQIVIAVDPKSERFDLGYAAAAERRARKSQQFAEEVIAATRNWQNVTTKGLDRVLEKYGAGNLFDAIQKSRKGEVG